MENAGQNLALDIPPTKPNTLAPQHSSEETAKQDHNKRTKFIVPFIGTGALLLLAILAFTMSGNSGRGLPQGAVGLTKDTQEIVNDWPDGETVKPPPCTPKNAYYARVKPPSHAVMRKKSGQKSEKLYDLPYGTKVTAGCLDAAWLKATYKGKSGYVLASQLTLKKPPVLTQSDKKPPKTVVVPPEPEPDPDPDPEPDTAEIQQVVLSVAPVSSSLIPVIGCNQIFTFTARITASGAGTVKYRWQRTDNTSVTGSFTAVESTTEYVLTHDWQVSQTSAGSVQFFTTAPNQVGSNVVGYNFLRGLCL